MIWYVLFVAVRAAAMVACAWGLKHSTSAGVSMLALAGLLFFGVDTFRVLVEARRNP